MESYQVKELPLYYQTKFKLKGRGMRHIEEIVNNGNAIFMFHDGCVDLFWKKKKVYRLDYALINSGFSAN